MAEREQLLAQAAELDLQARRLDLRIGQTRAWTERHAMMIEARELVTRANALRTEAGLTMAEIFSLKLEAYAAQKGPEPTGWEYAAWKKANEDERRRRRKLREGQPSELTRWETMTDDEREEARERYGR